MTRIAALITVLAIVTAACGDSGGGGDSDGFSDTEQALSDAIRDAILDDPDPDSPFGEGEATCVGDSAVRQFGVEGLLELGITVENADPGDAFDGATDEQIDSVIDITLECVDFTELFVQEAAGDVSQESARCLGDGLERDDLIRPLVRAGFEDAEFGDDPEVAQAFFALIVECLSAEELANLADS